MNWKQYGSVTLLFLACAVFLLPTPSIAKTEVVYANYKYVMGDNDTKNDAKRLCFLEAKRRCLEKVGSYVESLTEVQDYKLTKDEIRSYTSAIVKVEVVSEKIAFEGESVVINTRVKAEVDADHTRKELQRISKDKGLQARIREQQNQIESLEDKIKRLKVELDSSSYEKSFQLRKERNKDFDTLDVENKRLRKIILAKRARDAKRPKIVATRARNRRLVLEYVEIGMTPDEVQGVIREVAGNPHFFLKDDTKSEWNYYWEKMYFLFEDDEYLKVKVLKEIRYMCKFDVDRIIARTKMGKVQIADFSPFLKDKHFNVLDFDFDQFIRQIEISRTKKDPWGIFDPKKYSVYEKTIRVCPEEVRAYIWGEE
jgi:hypothetical protein